MVSPVRRHLVGNCSRHLLVVPRAHRHHTGPDRPNPRAGCQLGRRVVNPELAIPAVIILGCALLAGLIALTTRKKRALWDIFPGPVPNEKAEASGSGPVLFDGGAEYSAAEADPVYGDDAGNGTANVEPAREPTEELAAVVPITRPAHEGLAEWHRRNEQTVSAWIENHQMVLGDLSASGLQIDMGSRNEIMAGHDELAPRMREAIASHPSPVMRAELSAMHVAGEAAVFAVIKSDYGTAHRQHLVYVQYRDEWIERLRQFSEEPMSSLRAVMATADNELEEIRSSFEAALLESDDAVEAEVDFEAPLVVREEQKTVPHVEDQPEDVLEAAVGTPEDTTADLEGGRLRRLYRRLRSPKARRDNRP